VPFKLRVTGLPDKTDKTDKDGTVKVVMPAGAAAILDIYGSSFELSPKDGIEALDTIKGVQRRLDMLGYFPGAIDGKVGTETDDAVLKLQADNKQDTDGDSAQAVDPTKPYGKTIQDTLKKLIGE
jgi:peptidoglycan hydrolase-like protein with peptidoglycan-binding domain